MTVNILAISLKRGVMANPLSIWSIKVLHLANKAAAKSTFRFKVGAVITKGGRVLSTGTNKIRYSKHNDRPWPSVHAEEEAIMKVLKLPDGLAKLAGATIYVSRITADGNIGCAKPCPACQGLIDSVHIRKVIYT